ncbi:MAG TPA: hypothetical protein VMT92_01465 [Steroidobacteraceae bacterium]|nr:hypothetical protein [Steroidobacteraceae bacterium]
MNRRLLRPILIGLLALGASAVAATPAKRSPAQPSSYAPRETNGSHVYGSPIETPVVGRAAPAHHSPSHRVSRKTTKDPHGAPAHHKGKASATPHAKRSAPRDPRPAGDH